MMLQHAFQMIKFGQNPGEEHTFDSNAMIDKPPKWVRSFKYHKRVMAIKSILDDETNVRVSKVTNAFGKPFHRVWVDCSFSFNTKINVYNSYILSTLLYEVEAWNPYQRYKKKLKSILTRNILEESDISKIRSMLL